MITNLLNNKVYIGQTNNPLLRWSQHKSNAKYNRNQQVITRAMLKHGIDNFTFEVIASCRSQEDADKSEEIIITQYDSHNPDKGYNIDIGGNTSPRTPEVLQKISNSLKQHYETNLHHMKGKNLSEEWKNNIALSSIGKTGTNLGKKFSDSWKLKISKSQVGKDRKDKRRFSEEIEKEICQLYLQEKSMYSLGKKFNCHASLISDILKRYNIKIRQSNHTKHTSKKLFSIEQEIEICRLYTSCQMSRIQLAENFGCGKTTIRDILLRNGVKF